ncbi:MAG: hypothetical protein AAF612_07880 [Planctomycetota bacterium]
MARTPTATPTLALSDVVWGEPYTRLFADLVLPTRLSPGNLGALQGRPGDRYTVYTTQDDQAILRAAPCFPRLTELIDVRFHDIGPWMDPERLRQDHNQRYALLTRCHVHAVDDARRTDSAMVFLHPDAIWSDGTFARLLELLRQGRRAVLQPGLRVAKETFGPAFQHALPADDQGGVLAPPRELVRLAIPNLHRISRDSLWSADPMIDHPAHLYFAVQDQGLVARCFHLHPLLIWPRHWQHKIPTTIDGPFLRACCPDLQDIHVIDDSDESVVLEISGAGMTYPANIPTRRRLDAVAAWAASSIDSHHRAYFQRTIRLHAEELGPDWTPIEQQAQRVARGVLSRLRWLPLAKARSRIHQVGLVRSLGVRTRLKHAAAATAQLVRGGGVRPHHLHHPRGPWQFARAKWWTVREQGALHVARRLARILTRRRDAQHAPRRRDSAPARHPGSA